MALQANKPRSRVVPYNIVAQLDQRRADAIYTYCDTDGALLEKNVIHFTLSTLPFFNLINLYL